MEAPKIPHSRCVRLRLNVAVLGCYAPRCLCVFRDVRSKVERRGNGETGRQGSHPGDLGISPARGPSLYAIQGLCGLLGVPIDRGRRPTKGIYIKESSSLSMADSTCQSPGMVVPELY